MPSELERFAKWLQQQVDDDARDAFSDTVVNEFFDPANFERLTNADAQAVFTGPCGDTMEIYLMLRDGSIDHASFMTDGCGPTIACGSMLTKLATGKTIDEAAAIEPQELRDALSGLPPENEHCADLAVITLRRALASTGDAPTEPAPTDG